MSTSRIATLEAHPAVVFDALLGAAEELGASIRLIDRRAHHAVFAPDGRSFRVSASVTESGYGHANLHLEWEPASSTAAARCAKRLVNHTRRSIAQMTAAPPPTDS
jgi:hypothetical protein